MHIGLLIYGNLDIQSGGYLYDRRLVEYLRKQGETVEIVALPWRGYLQHLADNIDQDWLRRLRQLKLDILIQDELNHPSLAWINPRLRGEVHYKIVSLVHHLRSSEQHPALLKAVYRSVEKRYLDSVDAFIFNSLTTQQVVESLSRSGRPSVVAQPGGDRLGDGLSPDVIRRRSEKEGPLRIVFIGNVIPRKGLHVLLAALERVNNPYWHLEVVGSGAHEPVYLGRIEAQIQQLGLSEQVTLHGTTIDAALIDLLKNADLLCVPSFYEGFGIVYLEGMAFGLPAIGGSAGAAHEIIQDGENGYLVSPGDVSQLAMRLRGLIRDRALLTRLSLAARASYDRAPGWTDSMASVHEFLKGL